MAIPPFERPLRVFVSGGTGFVGRELIVRLVRAGHYVSLATRDAGHADDLLPLASVEVAEGDVYSLDFLRAALEGCDLAVNLVGILNERGHNGSGFRQAHVEFTRRLLAAMQEADVRRLLQMSALNADPTQGASHYLRTKGQAEELIRAASGWLDWTIFRPSVIFGPNDSLTRRFERLLRYFSGFLPLARAGTRFAPVYVGDVAAAFLRAMASGASSRQTFELCGPEVLSLREIVQQTAAAAQLPCRLWALPDPLARLQALVMDFVPGKPFSSDNYRSLLHDSICRDDGLKRLGIEPASFKAHVPLWLSPRVRHQLERARGSEPEHL
jgi:NADH dehydrogenase